MEFGIETGLRVGTLLVGAAVAWVTLRFWVKANTAKVNKIEKSLAAFHGTTTENPGAQPMYIRRTECDKTSGELKDGLKQIAGTVTKQAFAIDRLVNYSRYQLTVKDGKSLSEANEILENGK